MTLENETPKRGKSRSGHVLILAVFAILMTLEWRMVKGMYYRFSGASTVPSAVAWRTDLDAALAEAKQTGKPVLAEFSAEWCPPCQVMKHEVWTDSDVGRAVERSFIPLAIDVDQNPIVAERYAVDHSNDLASGRRREGSSPSGFHVTGGSDPVSQQGRWVSSLQDAGRSRDKNKGD